MKFGCEDLDVWNKAVEFAVEVIELVEKISTDRKRYRLLEQVEASSASISMNVVSLIARGSLYETITLVEIFRRKKWVSSEQYSRIKAHGKEIASMLEGLINSISTRP
jgi:hypothetical protein